MALLFVQRGRLWRYRIRSYRLQFSKTRVSVCQQQCPVFHRSEDQPPESAAPEATDVNRFAICPSDRDFVFATEIDLGTDGFHRVHDVSQVLGNIVVCELI